MVGSLSQPAAGRVRPAGGVRPATRPSRGLLLAAEAETSRGARERAGVISSFALMVGLSVGSTSGLLISKTVAAPT